MMLTEVITELIPYTFMQLSPFSQWLQQRMQDARLKSVKSQKEVSTHTRTQRLLRYCVTVT